MNKKTPAELLICAEWVIPVVPRNHVIESGGLIVDKGKIITLGTKEALLREFEPEQTLQLDDHALMPGLINSHCHSPMSLLRGFADDKPLMQWLENDIWPAEQKWVGEQFVREGSQLAIAEMLFSGTTCFSDMYFFPEETAKVVHESGMRAQIFCPILDFPSAWASNSDEYLRKTIALSDQFKAHDRINIGFGPHAPYTVSDEPLKKIATYAEELQAGIQIHLHETAEEVVTSIKNLGKRPAQRLNELGLLSPLCQCVHMTQTSEEDLQILANSGAHVVHCPDSNAKLASGICSVSKMLEHNINVCLGTDGAASNNDLSMLGEMKSAALVGKLEANDASAVDAMTAIELATINGARALGKDEAIGSLEPGKQADVIAIDLSGLSQQPVYNPISQIVYSEISGKVSYVWVNGRKLVDNYSLATIDMRTVLENARNWGNKLRNT